MFTDYSNDDSFTEGVYDLDQELNNDESVYNSLTQQEKELISQKVQNEFSEMKKKRDQLMTSATPKESDENEDEDMNSTDVESTMPAQSDSKTPTPT